MTAESYGTKVVERQRIVMGVVNYYRKVWDNGFIDFYKRTDRSREPITEAEWTVLAAKRIPEHYAEGT